MLLFPPRENSGRPAAWRGDSDDIADYPNPDLAIEVDLSPPQIDRAGIYAALKVAEIWRFDGQTEKLAIDRLTATGTYQSVDASQFLPVRLDEIERWLADGMHGSESAWAMRLRAEIKARKQT